jgi:hypothetical protein
MSGGRNDKEEKVERTLKRRQDIEVPAVEVEGHLTMLASGAPGIIVDLPVHSHCS